MCWEVPFPSHLSETKDSELTLINIEWRLTKTSSVINFIAKFLTKLDIAWQWISDTRMQLENFHCISCCTSCYLSQIWVLFSLPSLINQFVLKGAVPVRILLHFVWILVDIEELCSKGQTCHLHNWTHSHINRSRWAWSQW